MVDFTGENLSGSQFEQVDLTGARFKDVSLRDARLENLDLSGVVVRGALLVNVELGGLVRNLRVNGVDVVPLIEAELDRRYPDRVKMRPAGADGFREAWDLLERLWGETVARARALGAPELLHERVDGEWSFIETLRHLVFATDAWVVRAVLGDPSPWHPLDLPHDEMQDEPSVPRDRDARPTLEEVLALRAERMATVRRVIAELTDERLAEETEPVREPGYPASESYPVRDCLSCILDEEWEHRLYTERDLDVLEARTRLRKQINDATSRLLATASGLSEDDIRQDSLLPGWTRGHVLTHIARTADALGNLLRWARTGEYVAAYASPEARAQDIEAGAGRSVAELLADLAASAAAFQTEVAAMPAEAWQVKVGVFDNPRFPAEQALVRRLVEVELHHVDLGAGYTPTDWPAAFAELDLPEPMRTQRADRLPG